MLTGPSDVLWSDVIQGPATDLFEIQDAVARAVTDELQVTLTGGADTPLVARGTTVPEAHRAYLRGRLLVNQRTREGILGAIEAFDRSLEADPSFAPAYVALAVAYNLALLYSVYPPDSAYVFAGRSIAYADRAISLDSLNGEAYAISGFSIALLAGAPLDRAERDFQRALDLQPSSADALGWYAQLLSLQGRHDEALDMQERSVDLDPIGPGRRMAYIYSAVSAQEYELALDQLRRARSIQPDLGVVAIAFEVWSLLLLGRAEECLELEVELLAYDAMCLYEVGHVADAEAKIDSLSAAWSPSSPRLEADGLASYFAWTGQVEESLRWVERGLSGAPIFWSAQMIPSGVWDRVLTIDEDRVRTRIEQIALAAWERVVRESERVVLP